MNIHKKNDWVELSSVHKTYKMNNYAKTNLNGKKYLNMLCIQINKRMLQTGKRHVYPNVHRSTVYNSQDMEAT